MRIDRIFNHNVILSRKENGRESVYMGKGLAFQKKVGDEFDKIKIEKEFILRDSNISFQFQNILSNMSSEELEVVKQIIDLAEKELNVSLLDNTYITIADHIHYAIERYNDGIILPNPLLFETKRFYSKEYKVSKKILDLIKKELGVRFNDDEAGFIAVHLVNGQKSYGNMEITIESTRIIKDILNIINRSFGIVFHDDDIYFQRIVTHLQFFLERYLSEQVLEEDDDIADIALYELIRGKYSEAFKCVQIIKDYLEKTKGKKVEKTEQVYLMIHIQKVSKEAIIQ